jgi:hypothetical protein
MSCDPRSDHRPGLRLWRLGPSAVPFCQNLSHGRPGFTSTQAKSTLSRPVSGRRGGCHRRHSDRLNVGVGRHLKNRNWTRFALGYNGPNAEKNGYPHKLERAFDAFNEGTPPEIRVRFAKLALTFPPRSACAPIDFARWRLDFARCLRTNIGCPRGRRGQIHGRRARRDAEDGLNRLLAGGFSWHGKRGRSSPWRM